MNRLIHGLVVSISVLATNALHADERPDHFQGEASETLEQARSNFDEASQSVAELLAQDDITMADMARIHELTYTLENALERIDEEYDALEEQLEELHLASEGADVEKARELGETYLDNARRFR